MSALQMYLSKSTISFHIFTCSEVKVKFSRITKPQVIGHCSRQGNDILMYSFSKKKYARPLGTQANLLSVIQTLNRPSI